MNSSRILTLVTAMGLTIAGASPATAEVKIASDDGKFETTLGGRIQMDAAFFEKDNLDLNGENGTEFRRARLFVAGTMYDVWGYNAEYDFAGNATTLKDVYISYAGFDAAKIKFGQFKQPFGLEELTSSKYITFMERALPTEAFATSRRIGLGASSGSDHWSWAASLYGREEGDDTAGDEGYGAGARLTWAPWNEKTRVVHLGGAVAWEDPQDNGARFRARPEAHQTDTRLVDTGAITDSDEIMKIGAEAAAVFGPVSVQGEYFNVTVDSELADDPEYDGWYAYASWFLTGESRSYKNGTFGRVSPKSIVGRGGLGAWELAARYSTISLDDGNTQGGEEDNITVGLNWYATKYTRFMFNYVRASADPTSSALGGVDDEPNIYEFRAQIDF